MGERTHQKSHSHKNIKTANKKTKVMDMMKHQTWCVMLELLPLLLLALLLLQNVQPYCIMAASERMGCTGTNVATNDPDERSKWGKTNIRTDY